MPPSHTICCVCRHRGWLDFTSTAVPAELSAVSRIQLFQQLLPPRNNRQWSLLDRISSPPWSAHWSLTGRLSGKHPRSKTTSVVLDCPLVSGLDDNHHCSRFGMSIFLKQLPTIQFGILYWIIVNLLKCARNLSPWLYWGQECKTYTKRQAYAAFVARQMFQRNFSYVQALLSTPLRTCMTHVVMSSMLPRRFSIWGK